MAMMEMEKRMEVITAVMKIKMIIKQTILKANGKVCLSDYMNSTYIFIVNIK